jgi:hypothetical protein
MTSRRSCWLSCSLVMVAIASGCAPTAQIGLLESQRSFATRESLARPAALDLTAFNPAPRLLTYFKPSGIAVRDRVDGTELLDLTLSGVGREQAVAPMTAGNLSSRGSRIEIQRPGLVEWYVDSAAGLEQGFTVLRRPRGAGELVLELSYRGAAASLRESGLEFATPTGRRLSYGRLTAMDAQGRVLETRFEIVSAQAVQLRVDDGGANYPIVIVRS